MPSPKSRFGQDSKATDPLEITLFLEDSPLYRFDLSRLAGPLLLRAELGSAMQTWSASSTGGRRIATVLTMRRSVSAFLRWVDQWNHENPNVASAHLSSIADTTVWHLRQYRTYLQDKYAASSAYGYYSQICILLRMSSAVLADTRREASRRKGDGPPAAGVIQRYPKEEFTRIRNAARRCIVAAHARITKAYALAQQHEHPRCADPVRAKALNEVIVYGRPQSREGMLALGATSVAIAKGGGEQAARNHLFLSADEVFAAAVLIACHAGLNLSPIVNAPQPVVHEPGVMQLDLDKPRRGPLARFWPELLVDEDSVENDKDQGARAKAVQLVAETTDPARAFLLHRNQPSDRLLIYWPSSQREPRLGIPGWAARNKSPWLPAGTIIHFPRLRRSIPGRGVAKEPTHHNPQTYLDYVRGDPQSLVEEREEAALGVQKLLDFARAGLAIRAASDRETDADTDALMVNCSDPEHRPDTGTPCTTGFYSFLDCLDCHNAAAVPRLLPRLMAALEVLELLRDSMGETWERRFAGRYYTLRAIVERFTAAERELAAGKTAEHIPTIVAALRYEVPA